MPRKQTPMERLPADSVGELDERALLRMIWVATSIRRAGCQAQMMGCLPPGRLSATRRK